MSKTIATITYHMGRSLTTRIIHCKATHSVALNRLLFHRAVVGLVWKLLWDEFYWLS